jgi:hypothetical protein
MAKITCVLDKYVHRAVKFDMPLTVAGAPGSITMKSTPNGSTSQLEVKIGERTINLDCPGIKLPSKRSCLISDPANGQFSIELQEENDYRILLVGNELASDPHMSIMLVNKKDVQTGTMSDFFLFTEQGQPDIFLPVGPGLKIPPKAC